MLNQRLDTCSWGRSAAAGPARRLAGLESAAGPDRVRGHPCGHRPTLARGALLRLTASPNLGTVEWGVIAADQALHVTILAMLAVLFG
jgi:hypothetical protein